MCTLLYTAFTHFAVSQSVLQNRFTELRPSVITLMDRVDQSQALKCGTHTQTHTQSRYRRPSALRTVGLEKSHMPTLNTIVPRIVFFFTQSNTNFKEMIALNA
jgi:hypothetical protein